MKEKFRVQRTGTCKIVFIPKGYCTVYLENQVKDHIEVSRGDKHICIENLSTDLPCQKITSSPNKAKVKEK